VINNIVDLYAESIFGATKLPLWKVFKFDIGSDKAPYTLMGKKDEFKKDRKEKLGKIGQDIILMKLRGKVGDKFWYIDCLVDVFNENSKQVYSEYEIGWTNGGRSSSAKFNKDIEG
jgi:hypothetical protein